MRLAATARPRRLVSLVPMIDVLMIMLVFFMVTSTYLDLDMIRLTPPGSAEETQAGQGAAAPLPGGAPTLLLLLGADGGLHLGARRLPDGAGAEDIALALAGQTDRPVVLLPSPQAETQALVDALAALRGAGVTRLRLVRLDGP